MPPLTAVAVKRLNEHTRRSFVRKAVKEIAVTTKIIDAVLPYFPKKCLCIAGYLDSNDQYWKVNYHWDVLTSQIAIFLKLDGPDVKMKQSAQLILDVLMSNPPKPQTGYKKDKEVGQTKDSSSHDTIRARHRLLKQAKRDFEHVIVAAGIVDKKTKKNPPEKDKPWWLAVAPVAVPGTSNHGTGYALDIAGDNITTTLISNALGATLAYNEASHVHVEFANGVKTPA